MWPVLILFSYWMVRVALKRFERRYAGDQEKTGE